MSRPTYDGYYADAALKSLTFPSAQRSIVGTANGICGAAVVTEEQNDCVVCYLLFIQRIKYLTNGLVHSVYDRRIHGPCAVHHE